MKVSMKVNKYYDFKNVSYKIIKKLRKQSSLSQADLAHKLQLMGLELTSKEISKIENNDRLIQDFELIAIARALHASLDDFDFNFEKYM